MFNFLKYKKQIAMICLITFLFFPMSGKYLEAKADDFKFDNSNRKVFINEENEFDYDFENFASISPRTDLAANFDSYLAIGSVALKLFETAGTTIAPIASVPLALFCGIKLYDTCIEKGWIDGYGTLTLGDAWHEIFTSILTGYVDTSNVLSLSGGAAIPKHSNFAIPFTYTLDGVSNSSHYRKVIPNGSFVVDNWIAVNIGYRIVGGAFYCNKLDNTHVGEWYNTSSSGRPDIVPRVWSTNGIYVSLTTNLDNTFPVCYNFRYYDDGKIPSGTYTAEFDFDITQVDGAVYDGSKGVWTIPNVDSQVSVTVPPLNPNLDLDAIPQPGTVVKPNVGDLPILGGDIDSLVTTIPLESDGTLEGDGTLDGDGTLEGDGVFDWLKSLINSIIELLKNILDAIKSILSFFVIDWDLINDHIVFDEILKNKFKPFYDIAYLLENIEANPSTGSGKFYMVIPPEMGGDGQEHCVLDLTVANDYIIIGRNFLNAAIWIGFLWYILKLFSPKFNIG